MRNLLKVLTVAGAFMVAGSAAQAQGVNLRIGIGDDGPGRYERRIDRDDVRVRVRERPSFRHRIVERRIVRPVPRTRTVCRTVIRERIVRAGVIVRRPTQVCTTRTRF